MRGIIKRNFQNLLLVISISIRFYIFRLYVVCLFWQLVTERSVYYGP